VNPFRYERAIDDAGAIAAHVRSPRAAYLGGGTNLVDLMKLRVATPETLVDVARLGNDRIEDLPGGGLRIGGAVKNSVLAADRRVRTHYPALSEALLSGASGQLRNLATTAGNLLQRTRCAYFQDVSKPCNKREPGTGCPAREGYHRTLAILGASEACIATHPSDMAVALAAFDAVVVIRGTAGERRVPLVGFHRLPGDDPSRDTVLEPDDLIVAVELPALPLARNSTYRKARDRASYAFALVSVAAALDLEGGVVRDVRLVLGGVAHKPWRALSAETYLVGKAVNENTVRAAADVELSAARPLPENAFKVTLARNMLGRALLDLAEVG
jgi:xanthine dehydrogenase YagS FAD-binding subunit